MWTKAIDRKKTAWSKTIFIFFLLQKKLPEKKGQQQKNSYLWFVLKIFLLKFSKEVIGFHENVCPDL